MAEKRKLVLTKLATEHITQIYQFLLDEGADAEAEELMNDFLDVVFGEIPKFPEQFPVCEGVKSGSSDYRIGSLVGDFRVIFQILKEKVLILMILHESELPF
ncbi:MAG: type II toxin-antitoxin system RelE/ParE family toxin [Bacteroidetes bacterium]|nr:type II toxin-antitoxin system RelE/ParE family toxin [Bacteroidota bacterium]MCB0844328.1 type II toxin-antitoxin system RelE/ParE family toxin [Bacteroidota bacterium]